MFLHQPPGNQLVRLIVALILHKQPLRDSVLHFVGVRQRGVRIKADEVRKIVYARDVSIGEHRLDGMFVFPFRFGPLEKTLQRRRPKVHGEFSGVAGDGLLAHHVGCGQRRAIACACGNAAEAVTPSQAPKCSGIVTRGANSVRPTKLGVLISLSERCT